MKAIDFVVRLEKALMKADFSRIETQCLFAIAAGLKTSFDISVFFEICQSPITMALQRLHKRMLVGPRDRSGETEWFLTEAGKQTVAGFLSFLPAPGKERRHG